MHRHAIVPLKEVIVFHEFFLFSIFSSFLVFQASLTSFVLSIPVVIIWSAIESVLAGPARFCLVEFDSGEFPDV